MDNQQATEKEIRLTGEEMASRFQYVLGYLQATLGSIRYYDREELLHKMQHLVDVLTSESSETKSNLVV